MALKNIEKELKAAGNPEKAGLLSRFFKTGKGQYGEGDVFLGLMVPQTRAIAKKHRELSLNDIKGLLKSPYHEFRLAGLLILVEKYEKSKEIAEKKRIADFYLSQAQRINNWDLVDLSAPRILGDYLLKYEPDHRKILSGLAGSKHLFVRRIAILSSFTFIRACKPAVAIWLIRKLMADKHDLMHKASGWMLREIGKKDEKTLLAFLDEEAPRLPRTALRYAIERLSAKQKKYYMTK